MHFCQQIKLVDLQPGVLRRLTIQLESTQYGLVGIGYRAVDRQRNHFGGLVCRGNTADAVRHNHLITGGQMSLQRLTEIGDFQLFIVQ